MKKRRACDHVRCEATTKRGTRCQKWFRSYGKPVRFCAKHGGPVSVWTIARKVAQVAYEQTKQLRAEGRQLSKSEIDAAVSKASQAYADVEVRGDDE